MSTPARSRNTRQSPRGGARRPPIRAADGFTLFEVLIAAVILIVGLTTLFGLLNITLKASASTRAREGATSLARQILEDARTIPYAQLSPAAITGDLQAMNGLADASSATGWQVVQRGITYTVTVSECSVDDPKDGWGKHVSSSGENPFCNDPGEKEWAAGEVEDPQPADMKRVSVDVTWTALGRSPDVHQVTTMTAAGEAVGLTASALQLSSPTVSTPTKPIISEQPLSNTLTFTVTAPSGTTAMRWSLEGVIQTPDPALSSGTTWTFSWPIPTPAVSDGTYQVSVQAIDATGVTGPPVSIPVTLIRNIPSAPSGIKAGFNTIYESGAPKKVAELQWKANPERNVIGYRVYNGERLVCPKALTVLSLALSCIDFEPPGPGESEAKRTYAVRALYRNALGELLQGPAGAFAITGGPPPGPNVPTGPLTATKNGDGSVTLNWSAPAGGVAVAFYRVYRESENYTSRYAETAVGTTTYTDTEASITHKYWVTAVSANMTESPFLGWVSG